MVNRRVTLYMAAIGEDLLVNCAIELLQGLLSVPLALDMGEFGKAEADQCGDGRRAGRRLNSTAAQMA